MRYATWAVLLLAAGCQSPRVVQRAGDEGVVALPANTDRFPHYHQSAARKLIEEHVGPGYEVVEEKEVTTGYTTTNTQDRQNELAMHSRMPFLPANRETTRTTTVATPQKEWQIHYRRVMPRPAAGVVQTEYRAGPRVGLPDSAPPPAPQ